MGDRPPRRGRRDNGLEAAEYAVAGDVDPRIGEHLLDVLALANIAAYLAPSSDLDPVTRSSVLPARPTDRLYVDRNHLAEAKEYLQRLEAGEDPLGDEISDAGGDPDEFEKRWRELVAQLEAEGTGLDGHDSDSDSTRDADGTRGTATSTIPRLPRLRPAHPSADEPTLLDALDADVDDDDDETFVPPPPPPLPRIAGATWAAVGAIAAGVLILVWPDILAYVDIHSAEVRLLLATGLLLAGTAGLVLRLRPAPDEEDPDPDDGARV